MRPARQKRKRVEIAWNDSMSHGRWIDPTSAKRALPLPCVSVGYLIDDQKDHVTIAQSVSYEDGDVSEYGHALTIPRSCIVGDITELAA